MRHEAEHAPNVIVSPPELTPKATLRDGSRKVLAWILPRREGIRYSLAVIACVLLVGTIIHSTVRISCTGQPPRLNCVLLNQQAANGAADNGTKPVSATAAVPATTVTAPTSAQIPSDSFIALGTNTFASQQPTSTGKVLATLMPWNGKIYMGYGDYGANTGPIHIMSYDPAAGAISDSADANGNSFASDTESVYDFRAINGALYALAMDPRGSQCGFMYAKTTDGTHWQDMKNLQPMPTINDGCPPNTTGNWTDAEHVFDMNTLNGTDLWVAGSSLGAMNVNGSQVGGLNGAVWRSIDDGATWTKMFETPPQDYLSNPNDYTRYYVLGTLNGKIYTEAFDAATAAHHACQAFDGTSWTTCPDMLAGNSSGWRPVVFDGKLVSLSREKVNYTPIVAFDGTKVTDVSEAAYDIAVDEQGKVLYAVDGQSVYATTDLQNWTQLSIANMPMNARSIAVANNILYIGTSDSQLYAASLTPPVGPSASFDISPTTGNAPLAVTVNAYWSTGGTSVINNYSYNFGDGITTSSPKYQLMSHTYTQPGTYTVSVTVTDINGLHATATQTVTVNAVPPTARLSLSATSGAAALGVTANGSASTAGTYPITSYMIDFGDGTTVGPQTSPYAGHVYLSPGAYTAKLTVADSNGVTATATQAVNISAPAGAYTGQYYPNTTLSGNPITRYDSAINFNWGTGSPMAGIPIDKFSVRWTRVIPFDAGTYRFTTTTDDGVRLYVDGARVIDKWIGQSATTYAVNVNLTTGNHTIVMEYFDWTYTAVARMSYAMVSRTVTPYVGQYFSNPNLSGAPTLTRNDPSINFNWGTAAPDPSIPADGFSARWTNTLYFRGGTYRFSPTADDGVRLYIDNQLLIDKWIVEGPTTYVAYKYLATGYHTIRYEYYDAGGPATALLSYYLFDAANGYYQGSYWNNTTLSGNPNLTRNDAAINFNWGTGAPASGILADKFSVRWTKIVNFTAGNHTFTTTTDDGVRLYIDDQLVIDKWIGQSATSYSATRNLTAGAHMIRMEYFDWSYTASARLSYN